MSMEKLRAAAGALATQTDLVTGDTPTIKARNVELKKEHAVRSQNERDNKEISIRRRGVFNGTNLKLQVLTEIPGYDLRWFNDTPGRLLQAQQGGWEFVRRDEVIRPDGNKVVGSNASTDDRHSAIGGVMENNTPLHMYLMKIRKEWREEDQAEALAKINETESQMVRGQGMNADRIGPTYLPDNKKQALEIKRGEFNRP